MIDLEVNNIKKTVGKDAYTKGLQYPKRYVNFKDKFMEIDTNVYLFSVESERTYDYYDVEIREKKGNIVNFECTCRQYYNFGSCKHIAACLLQYKDDIFESNQVEKELRISKDILKQFYQKPTKNKINLKKKLTLEIEIQFLESYYEKGMMVKFKIGEDRLYNLNNKMTKFLHSYIRKNGTVAFGKCFTYDPSKYFFSNDDKAIIDYLVGLSKRNPYYNYQVLLLTLEKTADFLDLIKHNPFTIINHGIVNDFLKENPIPMNLLKEDEYYKLKLDTMGVKFLTSNYQYLIKDSCLYQLPDNICKIIQLMKHNKISELMFKEEDLDMFSSGILQVVKDTVILDEALKDKIILGVKPNISIYLDLKKGIILGNIKLKYNNREIDYFDSTNDIVRDDNIESLVIEDLLKYGFTVDKKKIYMDDLETMGDFLENNLIELATKYEVFTSEKLKETNILKNTSIRSNFSIGQDNIMKYEFDFGNINNDEIVDILDTMKSKKKYFRLKNGNILNIEENDELKQLESLIDDMDISKNDLQNGGGTLPKYRAIYLDSVKSDKYNIIKTDNLFNELINNFNSYKNSKIKIATTDKNILRDYQETGVKWLYNIYKCGFGGILADEMGLGKSIQLIYFIKQIINEKKDAKILIVAPTSLIYNWKNEFDKFGKELKYKVFAENKKLRKKEIVESLDINIFITTYGLVRQDKDLYLDMNFELVAIDEAQNIKNINSQMTKIVKQLKANTKIALTGTPLENSVLELWSIFDFIMPGYLSFQKKYNVKDVDDDSLKVLDTLTKKIQPFILRRKKSDVIKELPAKIENNIYVDLNDSQKKLYVAQLEKTKKEMDEILRTEGFKKGNFKILQLLTKLRQLCIDPSILYEDYNGGSSKIDNLISIVEGIIKNGHKILLFTSFKTALNIVNSEFAKHGISTYIIDGSVTSKKRMELVDKFNQDNTNVFLITLKAGGTGLNLTSADVVIHLDLWWNPQIENQATDRAHRIGQKNTVEVIRLICKGTIEERILELQNKKKILSDKLIEGEDRDKNIISKLTEKDIKKLLALDSEEEL